MRGRNILLGYLFPELEHFDTIADRNTALSRATVKCMKTPWYWGWGFGVVFCGIRVKFAISERLVIPPLLLAGLIGFLVALTGVYGGWWVFRRGIRGSLRQRLLEHGIGVCTHCGYCLRNLHATTFRCPECGGAGDTDHNPRADS